MTTYLIVLEDGRTKFVNADSEDQAKAFVIEKFELLPTLCEPCKKVPINVEIHNITPIKEYATTT